MIIVTVEMHSAITGKRTHLGTMHICNEGTGTAARGNYRGMSYRKGDVDGRRAYVRYAQVTGHQRLAKPVWTLVAKMLVNMGFLK